MLRLSLKDFKVGKFFLLINIGFWTIMSPALLVMSVDLYFLLITLGALIMSMIPMSAESRDNTEILYISLPINRRIIVFSRYMSSFISIFVTFAWSVLWALILDKYLPVLNIGILHRISLSGLLPFIFFAVFVISILIPIIIRFGFMFSITISIFVTAIVAFGFTSGIAYLISLNKDLFSLTNQGENGMLLLSIVKSKSLIYFLGQIMNRYGNTISIITIAAAMALVVFISIKISVKLFYRKEF